MSDWNEYSERHCQFYGNTLPQMLLACLKSRQWDSLLDLGCGDGSLLYALEKSGMILDKTLYAVDISEDRVKKARAVSPRTHFYVSTAEHIPDIRDRSIDILVSTQVIEHVPDDRAMVSEVSRVLSDGGLAYVSTVYKRRGAWYFYRGRNGWAIDPTHTREYTNDEQLLKHFRDFGLKIVQNQKTRIRRSILGSTVLGRIGAPKDVIVRSRFLRFMVGLSFPVPGYYIWELVCVRDGGEGSAPGTVMAGSKLVGSPSSF